MHPRMPGRGAVEQHAGPQRGGGEHDRQQDPAGPLVPAPPALHRADADQSADRRGQRDRVVRVEDPGHVAEHAAGDQERSAPDQGGRSQPADLAEPALPAGLASSASPAGRTGLAGPAGLSSPTGHCNPTDHGGPASPAGPPGAPRQPYDPGQRDQRRPAAARRSGRPCPRRTAGSGRNRRRTANRPAPPPKPTDPVSLPFSRPEPVVAEGELQDAVVRSSRRCRAGRRRRQHRPRPPTSRPRPPPRRRRPAAAGSAGRAAAARPPGRPARTPGSTRNACSILVRKPKPTSAPASTSQRVRPASIARVTP